MNGESKGQEMTLHEETKSQWEFEALDVDLLTRSQTHIGTIIER
jgi:hypothetical protein